MRYIFWFILAIVFAIVFALFLFNSIQPNASQTLTNVEIGGETIQVETADTPQARERGLSGRSALLENQGMLFVFSEDGIHSFWMKDMNFPIDILWISASREIVYIKENASPDDYPATYAPDKEARYVLEVAAGFVEKYGVRIGDRISF